jgi:hypothetical protein
VGFAKHCRATSLLAGVVILTPSDDFVAWRKNNNVCEQATGQLDKNN